jgi:hypothetical protein
MLSFALQAQKTKRGNSEKVPSMPTHSQYLPDLAFRYDTTVAPYIQPLPDGKLQVTAPFIVENKGTINASNFSIYHSYTYHNGTTIVEQNSTQHTIFGLGVGEKRFQVLTFVYSTIPPDAWGRDLSTVLKLQASYREYSTSNNTSRIYNHRLNRP